MRSRSLSSRAPPEPGSAGFCSSAREGQGLDTATLTHADARVRIPIDVAVDSLNVVVAAGIALDRLRGN